MSVNLKDIDPAVVASAGEKPKTAPPPPAPPKKEIPVTSKVLKNVNADEESEEPPKYETDNKVNCQVTTIDNKVVAVPRTVAAKVPVISGILADQAADDATPIPINTTASALIAIAHWVEHIGNASGKAETPLPTVCLYSEMSAFLGTDWEKDFDTRLLTAENDTLIRVTNFAEQNGMIGLLDFCVVALSCAIRGKSTHEMLMALADEGDELTPEEIAAGKAAYPWVNDITKPHAADE
jgi:hypothetical protein